MNANDQFFARDAKVDSAAVAPLPASRKIYIQGSRPDLRVPMREIAQSDTPASFGAERNASLAVYDTSGPYTDTTVAIDIRKGLPALRAAWIAERGDTVQLDGPTSTFGQARLADPALAGLRFDLHRKPLRAKTGANVSQMHYARRGIVTPEMEFVAIRENQLRAEMVAQLPESVRRQHPRAELRRVHSRDDHPGVRPRRGGARARDHPQQHQSSRVRADDHRPQLSREDQCQHRQLSGVVVDRRGSREDDVGDPLGRRHGDGPVDRQEHP